MSLSSLLSIARSALAIQQRSVDVASHNIANASTEGYSRQRLETTPADPLRTPQGTVGRGRHQRRHPARARPVPRRQLPPGERAPGPLRYDEGAVGRRRGDRETPAPRTASRSGSTTCSTPSAISPTTRPAASRGRRCARAPRRWSPASTPTADRLASVNQDVLARMRDATSEVNAYAAQIADLNRQITAASKGVSAPDLEDRRDQLIDKLSQLVDVQVDSAREPAVSRCWPAARSWPMARSTRTSRFGASPAGGYGVGVAAHRRAGADPTAAALRALSDLSATTIPGIQRQLDGFAAAVANEVNAAHRTGTTAGGRQRHELLRSHRPHGERHRACPAPIAAVGGRDRGRHDGQPGRRLGRAAPGRTPHHRRRLGQRPDPRRPCSAAS